MDNSEKIRQYIKNNPGTTEYKIAIHTVENHICARGTAHNIIYKNLIPKGKIFDRKIGNSFHRFYVNNENEFNDFLERIEKISLRVKKVTELVQSNKDLLMRNTRLVRYLHIIQLIFHHFITQIAFKIDWKFKSISDREVLHHHLIGLLVISDKLTEIVTPPSILS